MGEGKKKRPLLESNLFQPRVQNVRYVQGGSASPWGGAGAVKMRDQGGVVSTDSMEKRDWRHS